MNNILEKIYLEKDVSTNVALFIGSISSLLGYIYYRDGYLSIFLGLALFSITKVIFQLIIDKIIFSLNNKHEDKKYLKSFSENEKNVILTFVNKGTSFFEHSKLRDGKIELDDDGFESLHARGLIRFEERGAGDGPAGFLLNEDTYIFFLSEINKKNDK